ncbi:MAG: DUF3341 domain-containing protein [Rhizobacter sp.]|nr:DUF3341 domain-containing protein [Chlorobiales bacterium]
MTETGTTGNIAQEELQTSGETKAELLARPEGMLAEFANPAELLHAAEKLRDAGYKRFDCHSPFPIHGMDEAMGLAPSFLGWVVAAMGITGGSLGLIMQWWMSTIDYPLVISGKPYFSYQAYVPVTFELTILLAAFGAVFGMFIINRLPRYHHPVFHSDRFAKVTDDGFFVSVLRGSKKFNVEKTKQFLESIGGKNVEVLRGY